MEALDHPAEPVEPDHRLHRLPGIDGQAREQPPVQRSGPWRRVDLGHPDHVQAQRDEWSIQQRGQLGVRRPPARTRRAVGGVMRWAQRHCRCAPPRGRYVQPAHAPCVPRRRPGRAVRDPRGWRGPALRVAPHPHPSPPATRTAHRCPLRGRPRQCAAGPHAAGRARRWLRRATCDSPCPQSRSCSAPGSWEQPAGRAPTPAGRSGPVADPSASAPAYCCAAIAHAYCRAPAAPTPYSVPGSSGGSWSCPPRAPRSPSAPHAPRWPRHCWP